MRDHDIAEYVKTTETAEIDGVPIIAIMSTLLKKPRLPELPNLPDLLTKPNFSKSPRLPSWTILARLPKLPVWQGSGKKNEFAAVADIAVTDQNAKTANIVDINHLVERPISAKLPVLPKLR